jgi:hypothetical protein
VTPHPADETLALYAGRDLGLWTRLRTAGHVRRCERCSRHVEEFRGLREFLDADRDVMPHGVEWNAIAAEMKANIRLGLAAGQCVAQAEHEPIRLPWRTPAVALPVLLLVLLGWVLQTVPPPAVLAPAPGTAVASGIVLDGDPTGIGVEQDGRGFRIMHPRAAQNVVFSVGGDSVNSRYMDADTGQVTISHVYAE